MPRTLWLLLLLLPLSAPLWAQEEPAGAPLSSQSAPIITPNIERREIHTPAIDDEWVELGYFFGGYKLDGYDSQSLQGLRAALHLNRWLFLEASHLETKVASDARIKLGLTSPLLDENIRLTDAVLGLKLLPGQVFFSNKAAFTMDAYLVAGYGRTELNAEDLDTLTLGAGLRILPTDWLSLRLDLRDHITEASAITDDAKGHNLVFSLGFGVFF